MGGRASETFAKRITSARLLASVVQTLVSVRASIFAQELFPLIMVLQNNKEEIVHNELWGYLCVCKAGHHTAAVSGEGRSFYIGLIRESL